MHFHMFVVAFVDSVVDNLSDAVVVDRQQLNQVERVVLDHLLFHMDHYDNWHKHHNHYKREYIYFI